MNQGARPESESLGVSVVCGYVFALLLMLFIFLILVPEPDAPSLWDGEAFRKGIVEMFANFRLLDELADLSIVQLADVGEGYLKVDLDLMWVSSRQFGSAPFYLAVSLVSLALLLRGIRQRFLAKHLGVAPSVRGQISTNFFGRGMNLLFPFGPGDLGTAQSLIDNGASPVSATTVVFHNRLFELIAVFLVLLGGFVYLGWDAALAPLLWTILWVAAVVSLTRPLGRSAQEHGRFNVLAHTWSALNGKALVEATKELSRKPGFFIGISVVSVATLLIEIAGYWSIKQAFSSPMDDYVLMKDLRFIQFMIVIAVANIARIVPYTFASVGVYEIVSVAMFRVFDQGFLAGTTVTLLDSLLLNGLTLIFFVITLGLGKYPSVFETWRVFLDQSRERHRAKAPESP